MKGNYIYWIAIAGIVLSLSAGQSASTAQSNPRAEKQTKTAASQPAHPPVDQKPHLDRDIRSVELLYIENALNAKTRLTGSTVTFQMFVAKVDESDGRPLLKTDILYYADGMALYCDAWLNSRSAKTALTLKPGDEVELTGTLKKREVLTKDEVQYHGYISGVVNGNGGGGTVSGGTVTRSWSVYILENATVKVVQTAEAKALAKAAAAERTAKVVGLWREAIGRLDTKLSKEALDQGLEISNVDDVLREIALRDPNVEIYDRLVEFYDWCLHQKGINLGAAINDAFLHERPKLVKVIAESGGINFSYVFPNGDNLLHTLLKEPNYGLRPEVSSQNLRPTFTDADADIIEIICKAKGAKGLGDRKDQFGITPKEYVMRHQVLEDLSSFRGKALARIRAAVGSIE